jgi:small-conductance mechanosensitive channel
MGSVGGEMNARDNEEVSRKARAETFERRLAAVFWSIWGVVAVVFASHEYLSLISIETARWVVGAAVVVLIVAGVRIRKSINVRCRVCDFKHARSKWKYCPGCATETDATLSADVIEHRKRWLFDQTLGNLYAADTTRIHIRRAKRLQYVSMALFVMLVFIPMPFYFVGPFVQYLAPHWHWFMLSGIMPFVLVTGWQTLTGCDAKAAERGSTTAINPTLRTGIRSTEITGVTARIAPIRSTNRRSSR